MNRSLRLWTTILILGGLLVLLGGSASNSGAAACNTVSSFDVALSFSTTPYVVDLSKPDHSFTATVRALDACTPAGVVTSYKGPATLTASGTPPNGQPVTSGAAGITTDTAVKFKQGVATVTVNPSSGALGVTLKFTDNSVSSIKGISQSFDVFTEVDSCGANDCSGDAALGGTSVSVSISGENLGGFLGLSLGDSAGATCGDAPTGAVPFGQSYIIAPPSGLGATQTYTATVRFNKKLVPGTGVANFVHCMATPDDTSGQTLLVYSVVQPCTNQTAKPKCILEQRRNNAGDLMVTFLLGAGDPGGTGFS